MSLWHDITAVYPKLIDQDFDPITGSIHLKDDGDGIEYISKWEYSKPIPDGLSVGKPSS